METISKSIIANLISKPAVKLADYSTLTKEEKLNYFRETFAKEIGKLDTAEKYMLSKVRNFKRFTDSVSEDGTKVTKENPNWILDALSFAAKIGNVALVNEFVEEMNKPNRREILSVPYRTEKTIAEFSQEETIEYFEIRFGKPENGTISVATGYGETMRDFLVANGFNLDALK